VIVWDDAKRRANIRKHGIDFADLETVFDLPMLTLEDDRMPYGELRFQSLCMWRGNVVFLVWSPSGRGAAHLISCRPANRAEIQAYFTNL
jgi:uncharacterized DUF497 family protein